MGRLKVAREEAPPALLALLHGRPAFLTSFLPPWTWSLAARRSLPCGRCSHVTCGVFRVSSDVGASSPGRESAPAAAAAGFGKLYPSARPCQQEDERCDADDHGLPSDVISRKELDKGRLSRDGKDAAVPRRSERLQPRRSGRRPSEGRRSEHWLASACRRRPSSGHVTSWISCEDLAGAIFGGA